MEEIKLESIEVEDLANKYKHLHMYTCSKNTPAIVVTYTLGEYKGVVTIHMLDNLRNYKSPKRLVKEFIKTVKKYSKDRIDVKNSKDQEVMIVERFKEIFEKTNKIV